LKTQNGYFQDFPVTRIGSIGSEFEVLRYRRRRELSDYFSGFDLIIVVTGVLQFVNVIPRVDVPIIVQCATRLKWERKSQYPAMTRAKRYVLRLQYPLLALQERRVLKMRAIFLVENSRMNNWLALGSRFKPEMWFPGIQSDKAKINPSKAPHIAGHFISVGRLYEARKGWGRLFLAYKRAFDAIEGLPELVVVGDGSFSPDVQVLLDSLTPNYPIKILGRLSDSERDAQIQSASYFLQTSFEEGLGIAALEAMSFGIPLICSETDGSREYVIEGVSGALVAQGSNFIAEFSDAIIDSQSWDYSALHKSSMNYFKSAFTTEISQSRLIEIIRKTFSRTI
jgi:glycosyltransferase involved in cell wall biosynthesis